MAAKKKTTIAKGTSNEHAEAILTKARGAARDEWGHGWALLSPEIQRAMICMHVVCILNRSDVQKSATIETLRRVIAGAAMPAA